MRSKLPSSSTVVRIWDFPTRIFHWLLVICVVGAYICVKRGGLYMEWHVRFGYATLVLVIFRVVWGFIGPRYARFSQFVCRPTDAIAYLKKATVTAGHNPLGAYSVLAMLWVLVFQAVSGLFTNDDIMTQGPLAHLVSESTCATLTYWHKLNEWMLIALISLHLLAIAWYSVIRRKHLVAAMITGNAQSNELPSHTIATQDNWILWLKAILVGAIAMALVWWISSLDAGIGSSFS